MKCAHCQTAFEYEYSNLDECDGLSSKEGTLVVTQGTCPSCDGALVMITRGLGGEYETIYPKFAPRFVEPEVPEPYRTDFQEAAEVLTISPKASAALSRRVLQHILREKFGLQRSRLIDEIEDFMKLTDVPGYLSQAVDAVRNVGNLAAHPTKDENTGSIVDVEPGEAEWLIEVLESMFDFAFVQPIRLQQRQAALDAKLAALGKPPMKK